MENMGCGAELVKFVLLLFNVLCMICGASIATLGAYMVYDIKDFANMRETFAVNRVAIITLVLGTSVLLISLLGCCGTLRGKRCQLQMYSVVMLILFVCKVTLAIYVWTQYGEIRKHIIRLVGILWAHRKSPISFMHKLEKQLKCCGVNSFKDYSENHEDYPSACCNLHDDQRCFQPVYQQGCSYVLVGLWDSCSKFVKFGSLIVSGVLLTASVFASYLAHKLRRIYDYAYE